MKKIAFVLLATMFFSCAEKLIEKPEKLIPEDKMTAILYDLTLLAAAKNTNKAILKKNDIVVMEYLFSKYKIDSIQFVQSDLYYASIPAIYETIYKEVGARLEAEEKLIEEERKQKNDSATITYKKLNEKNSKRPTLKKVD
ncbi:MAG: hypothetical protein COA50_09785 [Flavobacteriaceae bacterium]|nr:MAG: hypothetical protein COA50_09785 [Flavobacteriaceae bacterium]